MTQVIGRDLEAFRARFGGSILDPADEGYRLAAEATAVAKVHGCLVPSAADHSVVGAPTTLWTPKGNRPLSVGLPGTPVMISMRSLPPARLHVTGASARSRMTINPGGLVDNCGTTGGRPRAPESR
jgi:hypothetical protein